MNRQDLPGGTDSINIPKVTTGSTVAIQTADNAAVSETDMVETTIALPVRTIAGQQDVAIQLLEQSPIAFDQMIFSDLMADYSSKLDVQIISGTGLNGQVTGVRDTADVITVTYTDATPTVPEIYNKLAQAISELTTQRKATPECWVMHPRRWAWFLAALDTSNRPLVVPQGAAMNGLASASAWTTDSAAGTLLGLPVYLDANIPTNLGGGTEDIIFLLKGSDHYLYESTVRTRTLPDVLSANLTVRLQLYGYVAFSAARQPKSSVLITGTGLIAPTFA